MMPDCCIKSFVHAGIETDFRLADDGETHTCETCGNIYMNYHGKWKLFNNLSAAKPVFIADAMLAAMKAKLPAGTPIAGFKVDYTPKGNHLINISQKCPQCGGDDFRVENYDPIWRDGDVMCNKCDIRVRGYDAG